MPARRLSQATAETRPRKAPAEPLAEGIRKGAFSAQELETIHQLRPELIKQGLTDGKISKFLSKVLHRPAKSMRSKIHSLLKSGELPENPHKRETSDFTHEELETIRRRRPELINRGLTDSEIAKSLSAGFEHPAKSTVAKIRSMVKSGELPPNTNKRKQSGFTPEDLETIRQRRPGLIRQGLTDKEISRALSEALHRPANSIDIKTRSMVKSGELPPNTNKRERFTPSDLSTLLKRRSELIQAGLTDKAISNLISKALHRSAGSMSVKIHAMVKSGELPENPNKLKISGFTPEDLETIRQRRPGLIRQGLTDKEISRALSEALHRPANSITNKIRSMVKSGELPENPNKQDMAEFTPEDLETIRQRRQELIRQGLTDLAISKFLSKELHRPVDSIDSKLRRMLKSGELPPNPNRRGRRSTDGEVLDGLREAVRLYTAAE